MINVSNAWKNKFNRTLLPEMFVEIQYTVTEPGLQEQAVSSANNAEDFSDVAQVASLTDKYPETYSTLDYGCWGLDGTFSYFDGTPVDPGYVDKNHSTDDGTMTTYPTITIDFEERHDMSIPGLTITWHEKFMGWAVDFRVRTYNSNGMISEKIVTGNTSPVSVVWFDMVGYSRITVEILKWSHPYQRPKCMEIALGIKSTYTKTDLLGYDHEQSVDLLSATLPESSIKFRLRNDDKRWNPDNPSGFERYLAEQQELKVRYGMDVDGVVEWIDGGTFWLSEWSTPANGMEADFTARDAVEFMNTAYMGPRSGTLYDVAIAAFIQADIPTRGDGSARYIVSESLKDISTDFSTDDSEYTIAEILQMVAHAGCCVFYQDRTGVVRIEPRNVRYSGYIIEPDISYSHPEYSLSKPLKFVSVGYGTEKQRSLLEVNSRGETQTIDNPLILTVEDANRVGEAAREVLENRKVISGDFRADLRLDALDNMIVTSRYASNVVAVTNIKYSTTGGSFKGIYEGRVVSIDLDSVKVYSNEFYSGEVW